MQRGARLVEGLATNTARHGLRLNKRLLEHPACKTRLRLYWLLRYLTVLASLLVLAWTDLGHWLNVGLLVVLAVWAMHGWAMGPLRRAQAYRDGWVEGHHELLQQLPMLLSGQMEPHQWHRVQLAAELSALGWDSDDIFCELDRVDREP